VLKGHLTGLIISLKRALRLAQVHQHAAKAVIIHAPLNWASLLKVFTFSQPSLTLQLLEPHQDL
jgi:hypothetical protein